MKRFLFLIVFLASTLLGYEKIELQNRCVAFEDFSESQKNVILQAYLAGLRYGFGFTLAAIAWQESCAGEYRVNFQDPSAGLFHAYIPSVFKRHPELKENGFTHNMVGHRLVTDDDFAVQIAIEELLFWNKVHEGNWKNIVKSYNRGYSWQTSKRADASATEYYENVAQKVREIKQYIVDMRIEQSLERGLSLPIYEQRKESKGLVLSNR